MPTQEREPALEAGCAYIVKHGDGRMFTIDLVAVRPPWFEGIITSVQCSPPESPPIETGQTVIIVTRACEFTRALPLCLPSLALEEEEEQEEAVEANTLSPWMKELLARAETDSDAAMFVINRIDTSDVGDISHVPHDDRSSGAMCANNEVQQYSDKLFDRYLVGVSLFNFVELARGMRGPHEVVYTNVPHAVVRHSSTGFSFGNPSAGTQDLALNILAYYAKGMTLGNPPHAFKVMAGSAHKLAFELAPAFADAFLIDTPKEGTLILANDIREWIVANHGGEG